MTRNRRFGAIAGAIAAAGAVTLLAQARQQGPVLFASSDRATYVEAVPGVSTHVVWGDTATGPSGSFTKFAPGFDAGMHAHTNDAWLVVLKGAYLYRDDAGEKRVGPGDFIRIAGGHRHWSGGDPKEGAVFYQESFEKFD